MCFPIWAASNERRPRHCNEVTSFQNDIEIKTLTFITEGNDSTLVVSLPEDSEIEAATVDIEGRPVGLEELVVLDYTDTVRNKAWDDTNNQEFPITSVPSKFKINPFTTNDYNDVKVLDGSTKATMAGASSSGYPVQLYEFNLSGYAPLGFEVFWAGAYLNWNFANVNGMNVSIWNVTGNTWDIIGGYLAPPGVTPTGDVHISKYFTLNPLDYIHPSSKLLYVIVSGPQGIGWSYCEIYTNYISINITQSSAPLYPKNPYLNIGGDDDNDWTFPGDLSSKICFSGDDFINELQEHVNSGSPVGGMIHIPFVFGVASRGKLYISNLTIEYVTNKGPINLKDMPSISFYEDSGWYETGFDLTNYFQDADDSLSNLTFELQGNTSNICGVITPGYTINFSSRANYFGMAEFNVSCRDKGFDGITSSDDFIVYSNNFMVTVLPTDDPPVIQYIDDEPVIDHAFSFLAYEEEYLTFTVITADIDGDDIDYSINITDEDLILDEDKIIFLPKQEHVGFLNFTIIATETNISKLYDFVNISIEVVNTNDGPVLEDITDTVVDEDVWVNFTVSADDVDLLYNDEEKLTYHTNFTNSGIEQELWNFNMDTGNFSFLPNNSLVGRYFVNFSVEDNYEEKDWYHTIIEVNNVNDPPIAKPISFTIVDADKITPELENLSVNFTTKLAIDPDLIHGDYLTYSWDFNASDGIDMDATGITIIWTYLVPGNYTVTLTVSDSGIPELMNSTSIIIQVLPPKEYPSEVDKYVKYDTSDEGLAVWFWIILVVIAVVIIISCIVGFIVRKKRQGISKDKPDAAAAKVEGTTAPMVYPPVPLPTPMVTAVNQPYLIQGIASGEPPLFYYPPPAVPAVPVVPPVPIVPPPYPQVQVQPMQQQYLTPARTSAVLTIDSQLTPGIPNEQPKKYSKPDYPRFD